VLCRKARLGADAGSSSQASNTGQYRGERRRFGAISRTGLRKRISSGLIFSAADKAR
jgi:hypothetical protein